MLSKNALQIFREASRELPAYKRFLEEHGFDPEQVKSVKSLNAVPLTNKKNYLVPNKLEDLVWEKDLENYLLFCSTSGSTGEPYYFPRNDTLSRQYAQLLEDFINYSSRGYGRTLVVIGFGMGVWIGGIITLRAFEIAAGRVKTPIAILPTGYNKVEIYKALRKLSPNFDQTILVGYPPFIKELVDESRTEGINLKKLNIRLLFAAEAFTETFRNYVCKKAGVNNPLLDTLNIYGTADIGAMAYETPLSILIRRLAVEDPELFAKLFTQYEKTPTLAQYNPAFIDFETVNGQVVLTGNAALPLIRYAVGDVGGTLEYSQISDMMGAHGLNLDKEVEKAGIGQVVKKAWPFVFLFERVDLSVTLHGIIIYPEYIKEGLLNDRLNPYFTERFTMSTKHDVRHNQFLQVNLELHKGVKPDRNLEEKALKIIRENLIIKSSEFAEISKQSSSDKLIQIVLWPNGHPRYFSPGTKQKWVEKV